MKYRYAAAVLAGVVMASLSASAQEGAGRTRYVAIGNGATTPLCKRLASIANQYVNAKGYYVLKAVPPRHLSAPFTQVWSPMEATRITPDILRRIAKERLPRHTDMERQFFDQLMTARDNGRLVVERAELDLADTGAISTALHVGISTDDRQPYEQIDWSVHLVPNAFLTREEPGYPSMLSRFDTGGGIRFTDIIRYGNRVYLLSSGTAVYYAVQYPGPSNHVARICDGVDRPDSIAAQRRGR